MPVSWRGFTVTGLSSAQLLIKIFLCFSVLYFLWYVQTSGWAEPSRTVRTGVSLPEFQLHTNHLLPSVFSLCSGMFHDDNTLPLSWQRAQSLGVLAALCKPQSLQLGRVPHPLGTRGLEIKIIIPPPSNKIFGSKTWRGNFTMEINKIFNEMSPKQNLPSSSLTVSFSIRKIFITFQNDVQVRFSHFARIPEPPW